MIDLSILYDSKYIGSRITELRLKMNPVPSERDVSLSIGQNSSYITKITSGKANPTIDRFYIICEYFGITPMEFFNHYEDNPAKDREVLTHLKNLAEKDYDIIADFILSMDKESFGFIIRILKNFMWRNNRNL